MSKKQPAAPQSSPLPWRRDEEPKLSWRVNQARWTIKALPRSGVSSYTSVGGIFSEGDAALIVRRVNQGPAFDAMVEALTETYVCLNRPGSSDSPLANKVRAALKLAQEDK